MDTCWNLGKTTTDCRVRIWPSGHWAAFRLRRSRQRVVPLNRSEHQASVDWLRARGLTDEEFLPWERAVVTGFINRQEKSQREPKGQLSHRYRLTSYMRKMVLSAGKVLEQEAGRENLSMLTTTMPYSDIEHVRAFLVGWAEIQRRYLQELRRELERHGLSGDYIWVTELQEKRGDRFGYPCPHLHILFQGRRSRYAQWGLTKEWCRDAWWRVVAAVTGIDFDPVAATRVEKVRANAVGYIAKYLTKGGNVSKKWKDTEWEQYLPTTYGRTTQNLSAKVKKLIRYMTGEGARNFHVDIQALQEDGVLAVTFDQYGTQGGFCFDLDRLDQYLEYYESMPERATPPAVVIPYMPGQQ